MAADKNLKNSKNICILAINGGLSAADFALMADFFAEAEFTLIAPEFNGDDLGRMDLWTDGARSGFLKVLTISRRMSWSRFDLVINWQHGGLENALCFMLLPKSKIITKQQLMAEYT